MLSDFEEMMFWEQYAEYTKYPSEQRKGQAMMNALFQVRPDLYFNITGTTADCFNRDGLIPAFCYALQLPDPT